MTASIRNVVCTDCQLRRTEFLEKRRRTGDVGGTIDWDWDVEDMGNEARGSGGVWWTEGYWDRR
jgi:hypothetical protein